MANDALKKKAFARLVSGFEEDVVAAIEGAEFVRTPFPNDPFGREGRDAMYVFYSLRDDVQLDMLECHVDADELDVKVYFNSVCFDAPIHGMGAFEGCESTALHVAPVSLTQKPVYRWKPVPFLKIPKPYRVGKLVSEDQIGPKTDAVIRDLCNDFDNLDIIRSEWDADYQPHRISIERLRG